MNSTHNYISSILKEYQDEENTIKDFNIYTYNRASIITINGKVDYISGFSFFYPNSHYYICFDSINLSQFYLGKSSTNSVVAILPLDISPLPLNFSLIDLYNHLTIIIDKLHVFQ